MKRDALRVFVRGLVMTALAGCCSDPKPTTETVSAETGAGWYALHAIDGGVPDGGELPLDVCRDACPHAHKAAYELLSCALDPDGKNIVCQETKMECTSILPGGPPPAGLRPRAAITCDDPVGVYFAHMAHVEGAAVLGFEQLAAKLAAFGAPEALCREARAAADDERHHARMARTLARRFGATVPAVEVDPQPRTLWQLALDNAIEGGVNETYGAALALYQAAAASDRRVRAAFATIAEDELRHAELAAAIDRWVVSQLDDDARAQLAAARTEAAAQLALRMTAPIPTRLREVVGLPSTTTAQKMLTAMNERLWS